MGMKDIRPPSHDKSGSCEKSYDLLGHRRLGGEYYGNDAYGSICINCYSYENSQQLQCVFGLSWTNTCIYCDENETPEKCPDCDNFYENLIGECETCDGSGQSERWVIDTCTNCDGEDSDGCSLCGGSTLNVISKRWDDESLCDIDGEDENDRYVVGICTRCEGTGGKEGQTCELCGGPPALMVAPKSHWDNHCECEEHTSIREEKAAAQEAEAEADAAARQKAEADAAKAEAAYQKAEAARQKAEAARQKAEAEAAAAIAKLKAEGDAEAAAKAQAEADARREENERIRKEEDRERERSRKEYENFRARLNTNRPTKKKDQHLGIYIIIALVVFLILLLGVAFLIFVKLYLL